MTNIPPATILIVDDERPNRRLLELLLEHEGYRTLCASSGKEALVMALQRQPDLIMLDLMMPEMDGYQVLVALKADGATSTIPVIVLTALTERSARLAGLQAGAEEFLTKPVDRDELALRVRNLLRLKEYSDLMRDHGLLLERQVQARTAEILQLNAELEERVRLRTCELQHANEELESFSYSVSHDLRGPLASMDGFSILLARELLTHPTGERAAHCMKRIRAGISDMGHLIDALLSLAQVSRASLKWDSVDLSTMAEAILDGLRESDPGRDAQFQVQPGMTVLGDAHLLRQMLANLLGNAWKFSARKAHTQIAFSAHTGPRGELVHEVRDNGAGFDMTYSGKLFGAFQRLHTEAEFAGSGIGLATVQRVVRRHGGEVWAESAPDAGAAFQFTLGMPPG
ncbi:MAG: response regulator [Pseudomonadota bacterium]